MKKSLFVLSSLSIALVLYLSLEKKSEAVATNIAAQQVTPKPQVKKIKKTSTKAPSKDEAPLLILKTAQDFKPQVELRREEEKNNILKSRWINTQKSDAQVALSLKNKGPDCQFNCDRVQVDSISIAGIKINTDAPYYRNNLATGNFLAQTPAVYLE